MRTKLLLRFIMILTPVYIGAQTNHVLLNQDFETSSGGVPTNWTANLGTSADGDAYSGSNGVLFTSSSGSPNSELLNETVSVLTSGVATYLSVWVKPTVLNDRSSLRLVSSDGTSNISGGAAVVWNDAEYINSWHKILMSQYTPASAESVRVQIDNPIANDILHYDDVELVQNPLMVNGDMEIDFMGNSKTTPQTQIYQKNGINPMARETTEKRNGNNSIKCTTTLASAYFQQNPNYRHVREAAEKDYLGSMWVKVADGSPAADFTGELYVDGAKVTNGSAITVTDASGWVEIETPAYTSDDTGGGTVYMRLSVSNNGADRTIFYVDDYVLTKALAGAASVHSVGLDENSFEVSKEGVSLKGVSGNVTISDLLGRVMASKNIAENEVFEYSFERAKVYIVQISTNSGAISKKVVFN